MKASTRATTSTSPLTNPLIKNPTTMNSPEEVEEHFSEDEIPKDIEEAAPVEKGAPGLPSMIPVLINVTSRLCMGIMFIFTGAFFLPDVYTSFAPGNFLYGASFFITGASLFLVAASIDFMGSFGQGVVAMINASLYVIAAIQLIVGSVYFLPRVYTSDPPIGNWLYVTGTLTASAALVWDMFRLMAKGAKVPLPFIVALFSALIGALCFTFGACFLFPIYLTGPEAIEKGAGFFIAGGVFFLVHSLAVIKAYLFS